MDYDFDSYKGVYDKRTGLFIGNGELHEPEPGVVASLGRVHYLSPRTDRRSLVQLTNSVKAEQRNKDSKLVIFNLK